MVKPRLSYHVVFLFYGGCGNTLIAPNSSPSLMRERGDKLNCARIFFFFFRRRIDLSVQAGVASGRFKDIPRLNHLEELASGGLSSADSQMKAAQGRELA